MRRALEESSSASASETDLLDQLRSLQIEAAAKSGECEELRSQVSQVQKQLQESEGRNFAQMKESLHAKRLHDGEIAKYQKQIISLEKGNEMTVSASEASVKALNDKILSIGTELNALKTEKESLEKAISDSQSKHEGQMRQEKLASQKNHMQVRALEAKVRLLEGDKVRLSKELDSKTALLDESTTKASSMIALQQEHSSLQQTLSVNKETIQSLQDQVEALSQANKQGADEMETLVESITNERDALQRAVQSRDEKIETLSSQLQISLDEKNSLQDKMNLLVQTCEDLETSIDNLQSNALKHELELAEKERTLESLKTAQDKTQALSSTEAREKHARELDELKKDLLEKEEAIQSLHFQVAAQEKSIEEQNVTISELERECVKAQEHVKDSAVERKAILAKCEELEDALCSSKQQHSKVFEAVKEYEALEQQWQHNIDSLTNERDAMLKEREILEEDNEELLVQLGLIKHQLDAYEGEMQELKNIIAQKEFSTKHAEERLREAEEYIGELTRTNEEMREHPKENGFHESAKLEELQHTLDELTLEKEDLQQQVDDLSSTNAYMDSQVESLKTEKTKLLGRLRELELLEQTSKAEHFMKEETLMSKTRELEERCRHLDEICKGKDEELVQIKSLLHQAQESLSSQADGPSLRHQIANLERACDDRDRALQDKDMALEQLHLEVEGLRVRSDTSAESNVVFDVDLLNRKLQYAERSAQQYQERLMELEGAFEETKRELKEKADKLSEVEASLLDMELELDVKEQNARSEEELRNRLQKVEALLEQRDQQVREMTGHQRAMEQRVGVLQSDLDAKRTACGSECAFDRRS